LLARVKRAWRHLKELPPGRRFQTLHRRHQGGHRSPLTRIWVITAGVVIIAVGVIALPAPGPGFLVIGLGGALLARESLAVARVMDWLEVRARRAWGVARRLWARTSGPVRVAAGALALGVVTAAILLVVRIKIG
jgi:hypothetical protein